MDAKSNLFAGRERQELRAPLRPKAHRKDKADLLLYNARVISLDARHPRAEAIAVREGRIYAVGTSREIRPLLGRRTEVLDCHGRAVVPGFIDSHAHLLGIAGRLLGVDCSPQAARSIADIQRALRQHAQELPPGTWIRAGDYDEFYLTEKRHLNRWDLDAACPHHPTRLWHRSRHACVLNSLALALAGISPETPDPPGGHVERDAATGEPTGLLYGMGEFLSRQVIPPLADDELKRGVRRACQQYLSWGVTSLHDATASNDLAQWRLFNELKEGGEWLLRVYMMMGYESLAKLQEEGLHPGYGDDQLRLGAIKLMLGEAAGVLHPSQEELNEQVWQAHRRGYQVAIHAVEASHIVAAVEALERALERQPAPGHRHRIEHCSLCPPSLIERLAQAGIAVATQPSFIYYSGERYLAEVEAPLIDWLYPARSLLEKGLTVAASSDGPVAPPNPLVGIYAAVTRRTRSGQVVGAAQSISPAQALGMYTVAGAALSFEEQTKGSITPGKRADLAVLDGDPLAVLPEEIKDITVATTIVGGRVVWPAA